MLGADGTDGGSRSGGGIRRSQGIADDDAPTS